MASVSIEALMNHAYQAACKALDESVKDIFTESTEHYCPVDTGNLKSSAKNELITDTNTEHVREISYNTPYCVYVHEIIRYHHGNKSAKYLEIPVEYSRVNILTNIRTAAGDSLAH